MKARTQRKTSARKSANSRFFLPLSNQTGNPVPEPKSTREGEKQGSWVRCKVVPTAFPCCLFMLHVRAACPGCFMSMLHAHAACPCCMPILHVHASCPCCMSMLRVHAACPCCMDTRATCSCCLSILHAHTIYPCCMSILHGLATCPCCVSLLHVQAVRLCCMFKLYAFVTWFGTWGWEHPRHLIRRQYQHEIVAILKSHYAYLFLFTNLRLWPPLGSVKSPESMQPYCKAGFR